MKMSHPERRLSPVKFALIAAGICPEASLPNRCLDNGFFKLGLQRTRIGFLPFILMLAAGLPAVAQELVEFILG